MAPTKLAFFSQAVLDFCLTLKNEWKDEKRRNVELHLCVILLIKLCGQKKSCVERVRERKGNDQREERREFNWAHKSTLGEKNICISIGREKGKRSVSSESVG